MKCIKNKNVKKIAFFLISFLFTILLVNTNSFSLVQERVYDSLMGGEHPLDAITILSIDDKSIEQLGQYPWSRDKYIPYLDHIRQAKVIGFDVLFTERTNKDQELIQNLPDQTVLATRISEDKNLIPLEGAWKNLGYINIITDADSVTRKAYLSAHDKQYSFAQKIYELYFNKKLDKEGILRIHFSGRPNTFKTIPLVDTLGYDQEYFKNKIVLIGATAPDLHDAFFVPTSQGQAMPGVEIHANIINTLIQENEYKKVNNGIQTLILLLLTILMCFLFTRSNILNILIIFGIFILYEIIVVVLFTYNYLLDIFYLPILLILIYISDVIAKYIQEKSEKAHIINAFEKYVSKDVLKDMIKSQKAPKLGGEKKEIAIMFSDIRGFTTFAEKTSPHKLVNILNEKLDMLTKIILSKKGLVDKYIGDCIMAFWGAPLPNKNKEQDACETAIEMMNAMKHKQKGKKLQIGIGIHTGNAIIGNMGSENRFDYTAIGDTINAAARLESLTKEYGVDIIVSEQVKKKTKNLKFKFLDEVKVKGKTKALRIYELKQ